MVDRNTVLKNSLFIFAGGMVGKVFSFLFQVLVAQNFGSEAYGRFAIVSSIILLTASFVILGFKEALVKWVGEIDSRERLSGVIRVSFSLSLFLSLVASGILYTLSDWIALHIFGSSALTEFLRVVSFALPGIVLARLSGATLLGFERAGAKSFAEEIVQIGVLLLFTSFFVFFGYSFLAVGIAYSVSFWISSIVGLFLVWWIAGNELQAPPVYDLRKMLSFSIPFLFSSQISLLANWADTLLVGYFTTESLTGIYQAAFLLGSAVVIFNGAITASLYPNFSKLIVTDQGTTLTSKYREATRWGVILTAAPVLYLFFSARLSLSMLFGDEFSQAGRALSIIAVGNLLSVTVGPSTEIIKASGDSRFLLITKTAGISVNILVNILLIPVIGIVGAALGTAIMTVVINSSHFLRARQIVTLRLPKRITIKALIAGCIAGGFSFLFSNKVSRIEILIVHITLYLVIYIGIVYFSGGFSISEIRDVI